MLSDSLDVSGECLTAAFFISRRLFFSLSFDDELLHGDLLPKLIEVRLPKTLVGLGDGVAVVEVAGPLDEVNLFGLAAGEQPEYLVVLNDLILEILAILLSALLNLVNQLRERRGQQRVPLVVASHYAGLRGALIPRLHLRDRLIVLQGDGGLLDGVVN